MFSSATKKTHTKKKARFSHIDKDQIAFELRKWAIEELCFRPQGRHVNSRIPNVEEFKMMCRGSMIEIWYFVLQHVRSTQTVEKVKGNLKLASLFQNKKSSLKSSSQLGEDGEHLKILRRNSELRTQITQVEKGLHHLEKEISHTEQSLDEVNGKTSELEKRCALLSSYSDHCLEKGKVLDEFRRRIEGRISQYKDIRRKSSGESAFFVQKPSLTGRLGTSLTNDQTNSVGLESACTRNVRETCEAIGSFLHLLHTAYMTDESPVRSHNDKTKAQLWTSVENILSQRAAADIYASLATTALDSATNLQELTSRIDVRKDAEELKFKYENSGQLCDTSIPRPLLLSVHQLIEEGQAAHFQRFLETEKAKNEVCKGQSMLHEFQKNMETKQKDLYANNTEALAIAQSLECTELEYVASKATMEYIEKEVKELEKLMHSKQAQLDTLYAKYRQIQDFNRFVQVKQNMIQVLVKHNSDAKNKLDQQQAEITKYTQNTLCPHEAQITALSSMLSDCVSKEVNSFVSLPLHRILFSTVDGDERIPILQLSINRLETINPLTNNSMVTTLLKNLDFPVYRASEDLLIKIVETKGEVTAMNESLKHQKGISDTLNAMEGTQSADDNRVAEMKNAVVEHERAETAQVLPKVQDCFSKATKALSEYILAKDAVNSWWEQPAQYLVPWTTVDGMNMRQWKDQWTVMATRLRQLQMKQ